MPETALIVCAQAAYAAATQFGNGTPDSQVDALLANVRKIQGLFRAFH